MAYGDSRSSVASDTFDSSIDGNWANGDGDYGTLSWASGGVVQPTSASTDSAIRRNSETFTDDQYSKITIGTQSGSNVWAGAMVRGQSGTDESGYIGYAQNSNTYFEIDEVDSAFNFSLLANVTDSTNIPLSAGETVTVEVEGTTIRCGSDAAGTDVQKTSTTDATLTSGNPGIELYRGTGTMQITAWEGGNIGATSTPYSADLTVPAFNIDGASLTRLNDYIAFLTARSFSFTAQSVSIVTGYIADATAAAFGFVGQAVSTAFDVFAQLTAPVFAFTSNATTMLAAFSADLVNAVFTFSAQGVDVAVSGVVAAAKRITGLIAGVGKLMRR